jgi:hypothetical protein
LHIARVALADAAYARLFGRPGRGGRGGRGGRSVIEAVAGAGAARALVSGLRSNIELLTARGWR